LIHPGGNPDTQAALSRLGFAVTHTREWPDVRAIERVEAVVLYIRHLSQLGMLVARLRAKPRFDRRVLLAVVPQETSAAERQSALAAGVDAVVDERCDARVMAARILRALKQRPEFRCTLPPYVRGRDVA
jgi:hypothetical protein